MWNDIEDMKTIYFCTNYAENTHTYTRRIFGHKHVIHTLLGTKVTYILFFKALLKMTFHFPGGIC